MTPMLDLDERRSGEKALLLGSVRLGTFSVNHPQQSEGFVFTSSDPLRLKPLAEDFGGEVEQYTPQGAGNERWRVVSSSDAFTAVLPFADAERNLDQWYTLWARSGLKRRCDSVTCQVISVDEETGEIAEEERACVCAEKDQLECTPETRLYLLLPQTGLGLWRLVTHSKIAASHLHEQMAFIASVAPGRMNHLPIRVVYAPREIAYFDPKERKRRTTTKRVVSLSIAGDAEHALRALAVEPDQALIAAVASALADSGRELVGIRPNLALPERAGDEQPAPATPGPDVPGAGEAVPAESSPSPPHPERAARPDTTDDELAPPELWEEASRFGLTANPALKQANKLHKDKDPLFPVVLRSAADITAGQLRELIERARS